MSTTPNTASRTEAETIAELAEQAHGIEEIDMGVVGVPDGAGKLRVVDLEPFRDHPRRATAARTVYDASSFVDYLHRHETAATEAYADVQTARVVGILDSHRGADGLDDLHPGTPGWQGHRITLQLT